MSVHYEYYRMTFYLGGVYIGADALRCRSLAHALRQAEYVKLAYARNAILEGVIDYKPVTQALDARDVTYDVMDVTGRETSRNVNLATIVS